MKEETAQDLERDRLWCKAMVSLLGEGLTTDHIALITKRVNQMRETPKTEPKYYYKGRPVVTSLDPKEFPYPPEPENPQRLTVAQLVVNMEELIDRGFPDLMVEFKFVNDNPDDGYHDRKQ